MGLVFELKMNVDVNQNRPPTYTHPAYWLFMALVVPIMLTGPAGILAAVYLPLCFLFQDAATISSRSDLSLLRLLRSYATRLKHYYDTEINRLEGSTDK